MSEENLNEKVSIDGRTKAYRETVARIESARKLREQKVKAMKENKFNGLYDDGSGKGAIVPEPVDMTFHEAMKVIGKYKEMREKKKTLMGNIKKDDAKESAGDIEDAVKMNGEKFVMGEEELSSGQKKYRAFFQKALKKFGASSPAKMDDGEKKKFFAYVKANWKG
jgi:hypothetical protein